MMGAKALASALKLAAHNKCPSYAERGRDYGDAQEARLMREAAATINRLLTERNELRSASK